MNMPGLVDLQVNGYGGVDFSSPELSLDKIHLVTKKFEELGIEFFCPTLITSPAEVYEKNLPLLAKAMDDPYLKKHILGVHLEGPFISPLDGARGAHELNDVKMPNLDLFQKFFDLAQGKIVLLTLAPELEGGLELISRCVSLGVRVSLGHHLAEQGVIEQAVQAGAHLCTHLGNGLPAMLPRHPNPLWSQMAQVQLTAMIITDGFHLTPEFIQVVLKAKGADKVIVTSDCVFAGAMPAGRYGKYTLDEKGKFFYPAAGTLAGSSRNMVECIKYLDSLHLCSSEDLVKMGRTNALKIIGKI